MGGGIERSRKRTGAWRATTFLWAKKSVHWNIVPLIGMCENPVMLVLAYAEHSILKKFLENNSSVTMLEKLKTWMALQTG
jgi:hypothetical protein